MARFVSASTIAMKVGMSPKTIRRILETGAIEGALKLPSGHWRIPAASVDAWIKKLVRGSVGS